MWYLVGWRRERRWNKYWHRTWRSERRLRKLKADLDAQNHIEDIDQLKQAVLNRGPRCKACERIDERTIELLAADWPRDQVLIDTLRSHLP